MQCGKVEHWNNETRDAHPAGTSSHAASEKTSPGNLPGQHRVFGKKILIVKSTFLVLPILAAAFFMVSCKKEKQQPHPNPMPIAARTIKFILYTNKNFSGNTDSIFFSLSIHNESKSIAFDSLVAARRVEDIPNKANEWVFSKTVPHDDGSVLTAGFYYTIKNVGSSWSLDTCGTNEKMKVIEYPFQ